MLSNEKMAVAMGAVRDQVVAVVAAHEREAHAGRPCMRNRADVVAFLAHCLGVRDEAWDYAEDLLGDYDEQCAGAGESCDQDFPP